MGGLLAWGPADAATVRFEMPTYTVPLNGSLDLNIHIEYEQGEPMDLFSYGLRLEVVDPVAVNLVSLRLPLSLNYDGVNGTPAVTDLSPGVLGAKGTVNFLDAAGAYSDSLLATYEMQFEELGTVDLQLHPFNTLGATEQVFVSGGGVKMDDFIVFEGASVTVVPEPSVILTGLAAAMALLLRRHRG